MSPAGPGQSASRGAGVFRPGLTRRRLLSASGWNEVDAVATADRAFDFYRQHRMHEKRSSAIDGLGVRLSVRPSVTRLQSALMCKCG